MFIGRTDAEAEVPILWPLDVNNWLIGKDPNAGKDRRQEEKGTTEDEMVRWYHQLNGHVFEQAPGVRDRQGSLVCCNPWGYKEPDMTERLNWTELIPLFLKILPCFLSLTSLHVRFLFPMILSLIQVGLIAKLSPCALTLQCKFKLHPEGKLQGSK